jgi:dihydroorotase
MRLVELLTSGPARVLGHGNKGTLAAGADADVTIWNPEVRYAIDVNTFKSKSRNCPFDGWEVQGKVMRTIVGGETKYVAVESR